MNVLLTGGIGFIGSHTAIALASIVGTKFSLGPINIVLFDNLCNSDIGSVDRIRETFRLTRELNLTGYTSALELFKGPLVTPPPN